MKKIIFLIVATMLCVALMFAFASCGVTEKCTSHVDTDGDGIGDTGGYVFNVKDTSREGISDGLWYTTTDTYNGFFGGTKFIYGTGENDFFIGTENKNGTTTTFKFK